MPRHLDLDERRSLLATAVWHVAATKGISAVSVRTVAAEAGVAVGSLRHVFPTRAELLQFSAELMIQHTTERVLATSPTGDPVEDALRVLCHLLPLTPDGRTELEVNIALIAEAPALPSLAEIRDDAARQIGALCLRTVTSLNSGLAPHLAEREAARLHALIDGLALHLLTPPAEGNEWAISLLREELERIKD